MRKRRPAFWGLVQIGRLSINDVRRAWQDCWRPVGIYGNGGCEPAPGKYVPLTANAAWPPWSDLWICRSGGKHQIRGLTQAGCWHSPCNLRKYQRLGSANQSHFKSGTSGAVKYFLSGGLPDQILCGAQCCLFIEYSSEYICKVEAQRNHSRRNIRWRLEADLRGFCPQNCGYANFGFWCLNCYQMTRITLRHFPKRCVWGGGTFGVDSQNDRLCFLFCGKWKIDT